MENKNIFKKALFFAAKKHRDQFRKGSGNIPFIVHPVEVAFILKGYTDEETLIAAALLHDVIEDCGDVDFNTLKKEFGHQIANIVEQVSIYGEKYNSWSDKKDAYINKIQEASKEAIMVVVADKIANMDAYFKELVINPSLVEKSFKASPSQYIQYYKEVLRVAEEKLGEVSIVLNMKDKVLQYKKFAI